MDERHPCHQFYWSKPGFFASNECKVGRLQLSSRILILSMEKLSKGVKANQLLQGLIFFFFFLVLQEEECSCDTEVQHYFLQFTWYLSKITAGSVSGSWVELGKAPLLFFTFNLKASTAPVAQISRLPEYCLDVYKVQFQKIGTNKSIISVKEQEQTSYLLTSNQEKTQQLLRFSLQPVLFHSSIEFPLEKEWDSHEISIKSLCRYSLFRLNKAKPASKTHQTIWCTDPHLISLPGNLPESERTIGN